VKKVRFIVKGRKAHLYDTKYLAKMMELFSFTVPGYKFTPAYRYNGWDGKRCLMHNGMISVGLLRGFKDEAKKAGYRLKIKKWKDRPSVKEFKKGMISPEKYEHQNECVREMREAIRYGGGLVLSATGTGKTAMASVFASWVDCPILFVVDTLDLMRQSKKEIEMWLTKHYKTKTKVGVVGGGKFELERVTVATIQTLHARRSDSKFLKWFKTVEVVIIDEVHVQMARRNFDVMDIIKPKAVFGLTATLRLRKKEIRMRAYSICGPVVFEFPLAEAVDKGVLSKGIALQVRVVCDDVLSEPKPQWYFDRRVQDTHKRLYDYKHDVVRNKITNAAIVDIVKAAYKRGYFIAPIVHMIRHVAILKDWMRQKKLDPQVVSGKISADSRKRRKERMEKGEARLLLCSSGVFAKGVNIKRLDVVLDGAQQSNRDLTQQKYGRATRLHPDKRGIGYIDIVSALKIAPKYRRKGYKPPRTEKAAVPRFRALKALGIPIKEIEYESGKQVIKEMERMLGANK